jgi:outer membrane protein assembly factor BamE
MFLRVLTAIAVVILASCSSSGGRTLGIKPYRIEIQQGNFISQEMVSRLKLGMSKDQVRYILGTPLIADSFHAERWDYVFRRQRVNSNELEHRKLAVFFEDGKLKRIEGDVTPAALSDTTAVKAAEAQPVMPPSMPDAHPAQTGGATKPVPAGSAGQAGAEGTAATASEPQEKSWWQRLKEKF